MNEDESLSVFIMRAKKLINDAALSVNKESVERPAWIILEALPKLYEKSLGVFAMTKK